MSNKTYDTIKLIALIAVPLTAFFGSLCTIWNVPHAEQITASLTAFDTLLGAVVVIIAKIYDKKPIEPDEDEDYEYDDEIDEEAENAKEEIGDIDG